MKLRTVCCALAGMVVAAAASTGASAQKYGGVLKIQHMGFFYSLKRISTTVIYFLLEDLYIQPVWTLRVKAYFALACILQVGARDDPLWFQDLFKFP